ncbi:C40 family peptidase [Krasilnikovia sp. M28-CT-15]|uniref:C40 family peptidase n=1 Tax=Krasilnikovia sp. M28-CT-15 TaxID=3373540 RepID=UPI00387727BB
MLVSGAPTSAPGRHRRQTLPQRYTREVLLTAGIRMSAPGRHRRQAPPHPYTRRVLTASALALAVLAPAVDPTERPAEAVTPPQVAPPERVRVAQSDPIAAEAGRRAHRVSRSAVRSVTVRPVVTVVRGAAGRAVVRVSTRIVLLRRAADARRSRAHHAPTRSRHGFGERRYRVGRAVHHAVRGEYVSLPPARGMGPVLAFAWAQIGKRYRSGGEGPYTFDCSGFTKRAYARIGLRLPHSSGAQAAMARTVSRAAARPGDLVVGRGHVGVYMGGGMMIDAGNPRTGVVYRRLYSGLHIERL